MKVKVRPYSSLQKSVFKYDSSEADKRFFKVKIVDFLSDKSGKSFSQYMFEAVWERNNGGQTTKYCFFNERLQRVFLDRDFYRWMVRTIELAEQDIIKINP